MSAVNYKILFLVIGTIVTGCLNTILSKLQDMQCIENCDNPDLSTHKAFEQPVLQTLQMFIGESFCWIPVFFSAYVFTNRVRQRSGYVSIDTGDDGDDEEVLHGHLQKKKALTTFKDSFILAIPSICDLTGTTIMNIGLIYTPVSIYQMTRGTLILFVGLFSVIFLRRRISRIEWTSLFVVVFGVFIVGLSGSMKDKNRVSSSEQERSSEEVILGMFLIFFAMVFSASQFVVEEYILSKLSVKPLKLVGYEGFYGSIITFAFMVIAHIVKGSTKSGHKGVFDMFNSFNQMFANETVLICSILIMFCISTFNFFGISLTENLSATARSTVDTSRTLLVWIVSIFIGWETFDIIQFIGFMFLVLGTLVFNGVLEVHDWWFVPKWLLKDSPRREDLLINVVDEQIERM